MRFKSIRLAWFRGAADPVTLDANCKSMVVYGQNGSGKSSFVDAFEYVLNNGKLGHLTHEYSGRNQEKAIPNTHIPSNRSAEFTIIFQNKAELNVKITQQGKYQKAGPKTIDMSEWDYRRIILRQDEVAEFIRSRKGEKYSTLLPLLGLHELEIAADNLRQLAKAIQENSELVKKEGVFGEMSGRRKQIFGEDSDQEIHRKIASLQKKYCPESNVTGVSAICNELEAAIAKRFKELSSDNQRYFLIRTIADINLDESVQAVRVANSKLAGSVEPLINEKLEVLHSAGNFASSLTVEDDIVCPACGREIPSHQFKAHIETEQERLKEIIAVFNGRRRVINDLLSVFKTIQTTLIKPELKTWRDELKLGSAKGKVQWIKERDANHFQLPLSEDDLKTIEENCLPVIEAAKKNSQNAPPDITDLSKDKTLVEAAKAAFETKELAEEISRINQLLEFVKLAERGVRDEIRERSNAVIQEISEDISRMWTILHPDEQIEDVHLYLPEDNNKAIDIALKFHGKEQDSPRLTLSEGYRNSLGICIFLAMAKREASFDRPLILDDVVISLDRNHRGMVVQILEDEFSTRQVIVLTHDRDWYAELRQQLNEKQWGFKTLLPYETPSLGIRWSDKMTTFDDARSLLKDRPDSAGNDARKIMDAELTITAERLKIRMPYVRGDKNDKRMAHDFLERLVADGKKCFQKKAEDEFVPNTDGLELLEKADSLIVSWGNKSSHSFDLVRPEATKLLNTCEQALEAFKCRKCDKQVWFTDAAKSGWVQCHCGTLRWRYGKG